MGASKGTKVDVKLSIDMRYIIVVLLVIIGAMLAVWKPWESASSARTIDIKGEATISAEPDEFLFNPYWEEEGSDRQAIQDKLNNKISSVIDKVQELGVSEDNITLNSQAYDNYYEDDNGDGYVSGTVSIKVDNKELAEKIQNYLLTTTPKGSTSPFPSFSTEKRKELEAQAREKAIENAKSNAENTAKQLGAELGKVVSLKNSDNNFALPFIEGRDLSTPSSSVQESSLPVLPGSQDIVFSVEVKYEIN